MKHILYRRILIALEIEISILSLELEVLIQLVANVMASLQKQITEGHEVLWHEGWKGSYLMIG